MVLIASALSQIANTVVATAPNIRPTPPVKTVSKATPAIFNTVTAKFFKNPQIISDQVFFLKLALKVSYIVLNY